MLAKVERSCALLTEPPAKVNDAEGRTGYVTYNPRPLSILPAVLEALAADHEFLLEGDVFTQDLIDTWIEWKRKNEVDPIRFRPHPHEFEMYFDI